MNPTQHDRLRDEAPTRPDMTRMEMRVFGVDSKLHPITNMPLEQGVGAWPPDQQALLHCQIIEERDGKPAADAMRRKLIVAARPIVAAGG
jgi:hypothetical protein